MNFHGIAPSKVIKGFRWLGARIGYPEKEIKGDTYPMTWAEDDEIYTSAGDPLWGESLSGLDVEKFSGGPEDHKITKVSQMNDYLGWGGAGPKPSGMICVDGMLYLAFQNFLCGGRPPHSVKSQPGSDAHIVFANPRFKLWYPSIKAIDKPMFPGSRFGGPAFINFGKNNENARDEFVYAVSSDQWDNGSNVRLGRVPQRHITEANYWEYVCAFDKDGNPAWNACLDHAIPILSIHRYIGLPEMVYLAGIKRYLFLSWHLRGDFDPDQGTDLLILESPEPWGPFSLVHFEELWEGKDFTPYCPRVPLKWMSPDHRSGYIQFSGSWGPSGQEKGYYRSNVRKFELLT
ncbi:MAG: DUF4185 domain-containing protein [Phycisphaerales bacterium]|nr:DUF4185 domain-containing protein [Phycisphaerales bacterium]